MEEKTREQLELTMRDCLDRAEACDPDSEDYFKLIQKATAIAEVLNDEKKIDTEKEVELTKIEANSKMSFKDWCMCLIPSAIAAIGIGARMIFQSRQTDKIMKFEETNTWASSGGRAVTGSLRDEFKLH